MLCEVPLTKEQQTFATAHHSLVYKFLNENRLPEDEFYDVVIFGYLKAVRDYFSDLTAQQFTFSTIANRRMKFCLFDYFRTQERRKRNMEVLSIHVGLYPDGAPLEDTIPAHDPIMQQLEMDLLLHELAGRVSKQQMDIVHLKQGGYGIREIARTQKVPMRRIKELLGAILHAGGNIYHTSRVVAILEESEDCVRFETQNSHYHLSMSPFPLAAVSPLPVRLAACA